MKRIYTRSGDNGTTSIHGGIRVQKTDIRIEANGSLDELNVAIGSIRTALPSEHHWQNNLRDVQINLMTLMSLVATKSDMRQQNPNVLPDNIIENTEELIDSISSICTPADSFIL
ncbi:MAG: ATP:cob(I)alamin adenosyltransferase, partial [Muribaculaceae bacterium]|nr:ATP:cob(I)alamin adenosyltransferase [Muribaculaceae bacterium]